MKRLMIGWFLIGCLLLRYMGPEAAKNEKEILLVTDIRQLVLEDENEEFSHTQLLVLHGKLSCKEIDAILRHREISYGVKVAMAEKPISAKLGSEKDTISEQLKELTKEQTGTLADVLWAHYGEKEQTVCLPVVEKEEENIKKIGSCLY